jgi:hypothetical protein
LYVQYELDKIPGSFGRHGSSASEKNHSSIMKRLGKGYCAHPTREQRDLMDRTSARIEGKTLNIKGFNTFEVEQQKYVYFLREEWGSNGGFKVYNERYPENFIVFESLDARCTCKMAVAYLVQCRHEICLHSNQFKFILFDKRYHYRMKPTMVPRNAHRDDYYPPDSDYEKGICKLHSVDYTNGS